MSKRSRRSLKPNEKYLDFHIDGIGNKNSKKTSSLAENRTSSLKKSFDDTMFGKKDSKIAFKGFNKVQKNGVQSGKMKAIQSNKISAGSESSVLQTNSSPSGEVRRSSREPKANPKLKEFIHGGKNLKENFFAGFDPIHELHISPSKLSPIKIAQNLANESIPNNEKSIAGTSDNQSSKNFKSITRNGSSHLSHCKGSRIIKPVQKSLEELRKENKVNLKRPISSELGGRQAKVPRLEKFSRNLQRHINNESKIDSAAKGPKISSTPNKKSAISTTISKDAEVSPICTNESSDLPTSKLNPEVRLMNREIPVLLQTKLKGKLSYDEMQSQLNSSKNTIRDSLKKFLVMGTKVANVISETLKHNEEELLSSSSAFERKCLSIVQALAASGKDLEEEDMEKIIMLLDEEQEERRTYRQAFLESLRISHLTNMALYSQMLRLLKTL